MKKRSFAALRTVSAICVLLLFLDGSRSVWGEPQPAAVAAFGAYSNTVEARLAQQHRSANAFLAAGSEDTPRLHPGELGIERVSEQVALPSGASFDGALLHHWRGTAFARGAKAADFERLMRDFNAYPQHFSPQVVQAKMLTQSGDRIQASMRIRQKHVITVVMDTTYDIMYGQLDTRHGYSISHSTRIAEIDAPGTSSEHALKDGEEHGFLWRLNTYWSYEERDGGLYLQVEAISLTRAIPHGLGWVVGPYVESIPRESLEFTLRSACNALQK